MQVYLVRNSNEVREKDQKKTEVVGRKRLASS